MMDGTFAITFATIFDGLSTSWFLHYFPNEWETNPILGKRPSNLRIFGTGAAWLGALLGLQYGLHGQWQQTMEHINILLAGIHLMAGYQNFAENGSNPIKALIQVFKGGE